MWRGEVLSDQEVYSRFDNLRFPLILLVIYLHNAKLQAVVGTETETVSGGGIVDVLIDMISQGWARAAVPLFFFMSGYLFLFRFQATVAGYVAKYRSRLWTLVLPYLLWNGLVAVLFLIAQSLPQTAALFNAGKEPLAAMSLPAFLGAVFGFPGAPIAYQFWFIRDLILLVLLTPLLGRIARLQIAPVILVLLGVLWLLRLWPVPMPSAEASLFYMLGLVLAVRGRNPFPASVAGWIGVVVAMVAFVLQAQHRSPDLDQLFRDIGLSGAFVAVLALSACRVRFFAALAPVSFFVFAMHEPLLTLVRKLAIRALPEGQGASLLFYLLVPPLVAAICVGVHAVSLRLWPQATHLLAGRRR